MAGPALVIRIIVARFNSHQGTLKRYSLLFTSPGGYKVLGREIDTERELTWGSASSGVGVGCVGYPGFTLYWYI